MESAVGKATLTLPDPPDQRLDGSSAEQVMSVDKTHLASSPVVNVVQQPIVNAPVTHVAPLEVDAQQHGETEDLWDFGADPTASNSVPAQATFLNVYEIRKSQKTPLWQILLVITIFSLIGGVGLYRYETGYWPFLEALQAGFRTPKNFDQGRVRLVEAKKNEPLTETLASKEAPVKPKGLAPYSYLPNKLIQGHETTVMRPWNRSEQAHFEKLSKHRFFFQRFSAVEAARVQKLSGSEKIFYKALSEKKLWIRMHSLIGLAENGIPPKTEHVMLALRNTRNSTLTNFLKRYERPGLNAGERFVFRAILPFVHESARLRALKALEMNRDEIFGYYLYAARNDPSDGIREWANSVDLPKEFNHERTVAFNESLSQGVPIPYLRGGRDAFIDRAKGDSESSQTNGLSSPEKETPHKSRRPIVEFYEYDG